MIQDLAMENQAFFILSTIYILANLAKLVRFKKKKVCFFATFFIFRSPPLRLGKKAISFLLFYSVFSRLLKVNSLKLPQAGIYR